MTDFHPAADQAVSPLSQSLVQAAESHRRAWNATAPCWTSCRIALGCPV